MEELFRVEKQYYTLHTDPLKRNLTTTYYIRDAQGNIMATYERKQLLDYTLGDPTIDLYSGFSVLDDKLSLSEWPIYGSARLGVLDLNGKGELYNNGTAMWTKPLSHTKAGYRQYEIANHLGNVLATISDVKQGIDDPVDGTIDYYNPVPLSRQDYYPFGMIMPGRNDAKKEYRFGFNGQEKTDEISGKGNHSTAMFWEYDTRLGRRWNRDPKPNPSISNYATFANNPIYYMDLLGDTLRGSSASDASKMVNEMKSIFGSKSELFNSHFKLGSDGKTFEKIKNVREFNKWLHGKGEYKGKGSGFTKEQIALANGFMKTINSGFNIEVNFSPGSSVFKASSSMSGTAYIGDDNGNFTDQNGEERAYSQTQTFIHELLGEGYTAMMFGDLEKSEAFTEMGQRGLLNQTQMRLFNAQQVQIIQIENLYNAAHGYLRTGLGRNAINEPIGGHFLNPSDKPNIGLIPANFSSSFYVKGDWVWRK